MLDVRVRMLYNVKRRCAREKLGGRRMERRTCRSARRSWSRRKSLLPGWPLRWILTSRSVSAGPTCTLPSLSGPSPTSPALHASLPLRHTSHCGDTPGSASKSPRRSSRATLRVRKRRMKFWLQWCRICSLFLYQDEDDKQIHTGERTGTGTGIEIKAPEATRPSHPPIAPNSPYRLLPPGPTHLPQTHHRHHARPYRVHARSSPLTPYLSSPVPRQRGITRLAPGTEPSRVVHPV